jgi:hypothetical protein
LVKKSIKCASILWDEVERLIVPELLSWGFRPASWNGKYVYRDSRAITLNLVHRDTYPNIWTIQLWIDRKYLRIAFDFATYPGDPASPTFEGGDVPPDFRTANDYRNDYSYELLRTTWYAITHLFYGYRMKDYGNYEKNVKGARKVTQEFLHDLKYVKAFIFSNYRGRRIGVIDRKALLASINHPTS